jgi:DGQHR domain-containing protein
MTSRYIGNTIGVTFYGAAGNQFGRNIFTTMIPFKSVERFLVVFPEVQRKVNKARVKSIAQYILKGLAARNYCFLSALTATCRGDIQYDPNTSQVTIDINAVLSINDGQHRCEGIKLALQHVRKELQEASTPEEAARVKEKLERLENMCVPVVIFEGLDEKQEQQLFHDLNLLAVKPNKSVSLKFDNTDLYNLMAKELKDENEYLRRYGVETEKTQLKETNPNLMVLSTLRNMISFIIAGTDKENDVLTLDNYDENKQMVNEVLNEIFRVLPQANDRNTYILGLAATLQGIAKYVHYLLNSNDILNWKEYVAGLGNINWRHDNQAWNGYGGSFDPIKRKFVFGGTGGGIKGVFKFLIDNNRPVTQAAS